MSAFMKISLACLLKFWLENICAVFNFCAVINFFDWPYMVDKLSRDVKEKELIKDLYLVLK